MNESKQKSVIKNWFICEKSVEKAVIDLNRVSKFHKHLVYEKYYIRFSFSRDYSTRVSYTNEETRDKDYQKLLSHITD